MNQELEQRLLDDVHQELELAIHRAFTKIESDGSRAKLMLERGDYAMLKTWTEEGITMGLIDAIISISRILAKRDLNSPLVQESLKDLRIDDDVKFVIIL